MAKRKTKAPKKTRDVYLSRSIREATTTKNKRGGGKKTKTVRATQGFVGSGTKTVVKTDKTGKVIKKKTKDIGNNKANRQVARSAKKAARNIRRGGEDILDYKKGGSVSALGSGKRSARVLQRAAKTARKGRKAVDEGREKKADRLLKKAAKQETRGIKIEEREAKRSRKRIGRAATKGKGGMGAILPQKKKGGSVKVHMMYKGGKSKRVSTLAEHNRLKKLGYTHTKPKKKK